MIPQWMKALNHRKAKKTVQTRPSIVLAHAQGDIAPPLLMEPWDLITLPGGRVVMRVATSDS